MGTAALELVADVDEPVPVVPALPVAGVPVLADDVVLDAPFDDAPLVVVADAAPFGDALGAAPTFVAVAVAALAVPLVAVTAAVVNPVAFAAVEAGTAM